MIPFILLITWSLIGCGDDETTTPPADDNTQAAVRFQLSGLASAHALPTNGNNFSGVLTSPTSVISLDGKYYLFYNDNVGGWPPSDIRIGYAVSDDMIKWERNEEITFSGEDVPYLNGASDHPSVKTVLVEADGTITMYFDIFLNGVGDGMGRATAPSVDGPWTVHPEPVIKSENGFWDEIALTGGSVIRDGNGYRMYYAVMLEDQVNPDMAIGMATSTDGITWTKHPEPVLSKGPDGAWDDYKVESPVVIKTDKGYVMAYRSDGGDPTWGQDSGYGVATSQDGINWTRFQTAPVAHEANQADWANLWAMAFFKNENGYYLIFENDGRGSINRTRVAVTSYEGDFFD
ncbi:MAG: hypothetical protein RJQ09_08920 [Cyclobacteriaceae bacterium]